MALPRQKALAGLFGVPLLLWALLFLSWLRVAGVFDLLVKVFGMWAILGAMALPPAVALALGIRSLRQGGRRAPGWATTAGGGLLVVLFAALLGAPLALQGCQAKTPKNPGAPRPVAAPAGLPVFPGAEGFGTRTRAGRGGKVIEVTSLADDGPGSLRAALDDPAPRIVVFRAGGTIELSGPLSIRHPFATVAGQTAPGGGVCVKNAGIDVFTHDLLIQHVRIRPGNEGRVEPSNNDAIALLGRHDGIEGASNVVIDHVSASWGEDETISTWFGAHDITISWCVVSEALNRSRHGKGAHSAGLLVGDSSEHVSMHHNLLAHNGFRNPLIAKGGTHDFVNNVIYDWGEIAGEVYDIDSNSFLNFVGNDFRPGPSGAPGRHEIVIDAEPGVPRIWAEGNRGPHRPEARGDEWALVSRGWDGTVAPGIYRARERFSTWPITTTPAAEACEAVLARAGATAPARDAVDARIVAEARSGAGKVIDSPREVGGHPALSAGTAPPDGDRDGMPDAWERSKGLDPADASDGPKDRDGDGYTNVEEYLHSLLP